MEIEMMTMARGVATRPAGPRSARASFAEAVIILIALYTLVGLGIGSACGSLVVGMFCGLAFGIFAAAAVLLICGAAQVAKSV